MRARHGMGAAATAHRVVIVGAGYAGMSAAVQLPSRVKRHEDVQVTW